MEMREVCHTVVLTPEILAEWKDHQSSFARTWLVSMFARRKVHQLDTLVDETIRNKVADAAGTEPGREAVLKDCHLIEAAIATDRTVASLDDKARKLFSSAASCVGEIRRIIWVNPDRVDENCIAWLRDGAKDEKERWLGS